MKISKITIQHKTKSVEHSNKLSGHSWTETIILSGYEVWGGGFLMSSHKTLKSAEKEVQIRESINKKFPR